MHRDLRALRAAVADVSLAGDDADHAKIVAALNRLADVVRVDDRDAATRIDRLATQLRESSPRSGAHTDMVKRALQEAALALAAPLPPRPRASARDAYVAARRAEAELLADEPLRLQTAEVAAALRSVANLAAARRGLSPLFVISADADELGYDPERFAQRARRASVLVSELAADSDWKTSGTKAVAALDALADALAVAPVVAKPQAWGTLVSAIRYEALELEREGGLSPGRSGRVKAGLTAALRGLELAMAADESESPVIEAARSAIEAIDTSSAFVFQRAILQEAFRATADAYLSIAIAREVRPESA